MGFQHRFDPTSLREYDIRGVVGRTLSEADAFAIGRVFGSVVARAGGHTVAVGYDGRLSSPALAGALVDGLKASGIEVLRVGRGPTPMLYFAATTLETRPETRKFASTCGARGSHALARTEIG